MKPKNYTKEQFLKDVAAEVRALKKHATKEELSKLDIKTLDASSRDNCIYGKMTGDCNSNRACELIYKCCKRYVKQGNGFIDKTFTNVKRDINGCTIPGVKTAEHLGYTRLNWIDYFSSLEVYIGLRGSKNANVIAFLKDERKDLVL